jgi:hypothetical protein
VFDAPPKPLHRDVVVRPTPAGHADGNGLALQNVCEDNAGELTAMLLLIRQLSTHLECPSITATK